MLPIIKFACRCLFLFILVSYALPVYAKINVATLSAESMLINIATNIPNLMRMVTAFAYIMGMYFIFEGILKLKQYGESRSMMSQEHSLRGPVIFLAIGAMLIYFPTTVQVGMSTFWTDPNPYGYQIGSQDQWTQFIGVCYLIVQFVGTVSFIRGLVILTQLGAHAGHQQGVFAKGLTHIIGGIFCINIYQFVQVIMITLGIQL